MRMIEKLMGDRGRSIQPTAQIWKDQKRRERRRRKALASVLRPLCHAVEEITIESRAMSGERDRKGRLSVKLFEIGNLEVADL